MFPINFLLSIFRFLILGISMLVLDYNITILSIKLLWYYKMGYVCILLGNYNLCSYFEMYIKTHLISKLQFQQAQNQQFVQYQPEEVFQMLGLEQRCTTGFILRVVSGVAVLWQSGITHALISRRSSRILVSQESSAAES